MSNLKEVVGDMGKAVRWTEQPKNDKEKENTIFVGDTVHGILENVRHGVGENNATIYEINTLDHGVLTIWDTTVLHDKMRKVLVGYEVKIVYTGEQSPKGGGKAYKTFQVFYGEEPDADMVKKLDEARLKEVEAADIPLS